MLLKNLIFLLVISLLTKACQGKVSDSSGPFLNDAFYKIASEKEINYVSNNKQIDFVSAGGTFNAATSTVSASSTMIRNLEVPNSVPKGSPVLLHCDFEETNLYSIKWYKNYVEFYRYVPSNTGKPAQEFRLRGVHLDLNLCNISHVYLTKVDLDSEGVYACEVSADGPFFATARMQKQMKVYVLPDVDNLKLSSSSHIFYYARKMGKTELQVNASLGETLQLNCETGVSAPEMQISWLINELPATSNLITQYSPLPISPGSPLLISRSSLQMPLDNGLLFPETEVIKVKCTSKLMLKYEHRSIEVLSSSIHGNRKYFYISKDWYNNNNRDLNPLILFEQNIAQFDIDDFLHVNCSSNLTNSVLKWFINDLEIENEHLISYHIDNKYPVLLLTMRLEETWFERYNELKLECRVIVYETVANFQRKLNVQVKDFFKYTYPTKNYKKNNKQSMNNGRSHSSGIHIHQTHNHLPDGSFRNSQTSRSMIASETLNSNHDINRNFVSISNNTLDLNSDQEKDHNLDKNQQNNQRSSIVTMNNVNRNGRLHQQKSKSTVKKKRKRPSVNLFNQLDYDTYQDENTSLNSDDSEDAIAANSLRNHCDSLQFVPIILLFNVLYTVFIFN